MGWKVPKMWEGGRCFILGGGPSIITQFQIPTEIVDSVKLGKKSPSLYSPFLGAIHNEHVLAINVAYQIGTWIDMVYFGDDSTWMEEKEGLLKFKGLVVHSAPTVDDHRIKKIGRDPVKVKGISSNPNYISWNYHSGASGINIAAHAGAKQIILLGFDMNMIDKDQQHWHNYYSTVESQLEKTYKFQINSYKEIKKDADALGIEIINCNPKSKIECFKKCNLTDII